MEDDFSGINGIPEKVVPFSLGSLDGTCDKWNTLLPNGNSQNKFSDFFL